MTSKNQTIAIISTKVVKREDSRKQSKDLLVGYCSNKIGRVFIFFDCSLASVFFFTFKQSFRIKVNYG